MYILSHQTTGVKNMHLKMQNGHRHNPDKDQLVFCHIIPVFYCVWTAYEYEHLRERPALRTHISISYT